MATDDETVAEIVREMLTATVVFGPHNSCRSMTRMERKITRVYAKRIEAVHERDREAARRRAERNAIYNMLESFPCDWNCNPDAVRKWMTAWYKNADDLCEGGKYAER